MYRKYIILIVIILFSLSFAELRITGTFVDSLRSGVPELSVPNPDPPIGKNLSRERRFSLPKSVVANSETVRVCALRVQFKADSTPTSTGTGQFDLSAPDSDQVFDPPPHDKKYFTAQMEALRKYYAMVSDSQVIIEYDIFPEDDSAAYTLPDSMGYYGQSGWFGNDLGARLGGFFTDAIEFVDSVSDIDFCRYDVVIVFHAGSDWQDDVASLYPDYAEMWPDVFIPSPDDLPTAFVVMQDTIVDCVDRGVVAPESPSQDGQIVLLNGILAHEFGHSLGLVDLYSTYDFYSTVGFFTLMDNGHNIGVTLVDDKTGNEYSVYGALPVYPSAWERAYLGWEKVNQITAPVDSFTLRACELMNNPSYSSTSNSGTIVKIPIDDFEYFLLENRQAEPWSDDASVALKQDSVTGVILGIQVDSEYVAGYDFLLPGSGILIWHIDERVAYGDFDGNGVDNFDDNELQWDWTRPFVDIVEADGIHDIGMWSGGEYAYGTAADMWRWPLAYRFGPYTHPNTENYDGGYTGIEVFDISQSDTLMSFSLHYIGAHPQWKRTVGFPLDDEITIADLDNNDSLEILTTTYGMLLIWRADGEKFVPNSDSIGLIIYSGDTLSFPLPVAFEADTFMTSPSIGDINGDGFSEIVFGDDNGNLYSLERTNTAGRLDVVSGYPIVLHSAVSVTPVLADVDGDGADEIIVGTDDGYLYLVDNGAIAWSYNLRGEDVGAMILSDGTICAIAQQNTGKIFEFSPLGELLLQKDIPAGDLNRPALARCDSEEYIVITAQKVPQNSGKPLTDGDAAGALIVMTASGEMVDNFPVELPAEPSAPVICDAYRTNFPDNYAHFDIVFAAETLLYCYHDNGAICENFPIVLYDDDFSGAPIVADVDGDGENDIIAVSEYSRLYAYDFDGNLLNSYPLAVGASSSSPAAADVDGDGEFELFIGSYEGTLFRWNGFGENIGWGQFGLVSGNRVFSPQTIEYNSSADLNVENFYNYPNPAGEKTYFRFLIESSSANCAEAKIKIFDEGGNLVTELEEDVSTGVPEEILWDTARVASGIYWAVLDIESDGEHIQQKHIVAIVK